MGTALRALEPISVGLLIYDIGKQTAEFMNALFNKNSPEAKKYWNDARKNTTTIGHYNNQ
ncbi:hypothetical protein OZ664_20090 [Elizabethkingia sp. HX WHF]|uniref:hypothetical protein n=1 Tax=Elizabethkingia TaxID=308865 RepID=UPI001056C569|nr:MULTISPECIES: hypothetical protein [Elizabethkingia]MCL1639999.1 hypothetical protein [Elizabethkingia bruuniana]MDX8566319.1 hypothetical protein [Elizabethkingia sp. HX WHF]